MSNLKSFKMKNEVTNKLSLNSSIMEQFENEEMLLIKGGGILGSIWDSICDAINFANCNANCHGCGCTNNGC
jgi:hypothetical protein